MQTIPFELAFWEAFQFAGEDMCRYNLSCVEITGNQVRATNGSVAYIADVLPEEVPVKGIFCRHLESSDPKRPNKNKRYELRVDGGGTDAVYLSILGTTFRKLSSGRFPNLSTIVPESDTVVELNGFYRAIREAREAGKMKSRELKAEDKKKQWKKETRPGRYVYLEGYLYVAETLHIAVGYGIDNRRDFELVSHRELGRAGCEENPSFITFNPDLYRLTRHPQTLGFNAGHNISVLDIGLRGRRVILLPYNTEGPKDPIYRADDTRERVLAFMRK